MWYLTDLTSFTTTTTDPSAEGWVTPQLSFGLPFWELTRQPVFKTMVKYLNAIQFDMILLANKNMKHYRRTWYNYPRDAEVGWLNKWFRRKIGLSWLDDNRGVLKKDGWVYRWQKGLPVDGGMFHGSEARGQFTWKIVSLLSSRGIAVFRGVYDTARKFFKPLKPPTTTPFEVSEDRRAPPKKPGPSDFEDP